MATKKPGTPAPAVNYREADKGRYVSKEYAEKNPKTTLKETDRPSPPKKSK